MNGVYLMHTKIHVADISFMNNISSLTADVNGSVEER